ncbi:hypothetical protein [Colwellia echini]|uniref:LPS export ABC transporter periplasmic protein LptC n=1 Tax=Colwellia echini TaxID=1982103 RepID=A0ABY3MUS7_9GAMM|nr:hypothetical protein [Colwellia echini]TYK64963.1 hypothetical protein CWS31_012610 [Colwellia echini]
MTNTKHKFYRKTEDNRTKLSFEITAERFIEDFSQLNKKSYFLFSHLSSKKVTTFEQGTLYLKNSHLHFNQAFWHQGKLVLKDTSGIINNQKFNAPEIRFNKTKMDVIAKKITLKSKNKISRKLNFQQTVEPITYPYQKVSFFSPPQIP